MVLGSTPIIGKIMTRKKENLQGPTIVELSDQDYKEALKSEEEKRISAMPWYEKLDKGLEHGIEKTGQGMVQVPITWVLL